MTSLLAKRSLLVRSFFRDWRFFRLHWLTSVSGIAIAVCIVSAVGIAIDKTKRAIEHNHESLNAGSSYRVESATGWISENLYRRAILEYGIASLSPVIQAWVNVGDSEQKAILLGLDLMRASGAPRSAASPAMVETDFMRLLSDPRAVAVGSALLGQIGDPDYAPNVDLHLEYSGRHLSARVATTIADAFSNKYPVFERAVVADISTVQELLGVEGFISYLNVESGADARELEAISRLVSQNDPELTLVSQAQYFEEAESLPRAFYANIEIIGWLALLLGAMIALNATLYVVRLRRPVIGTLRALGVTANEILFLQGISFFLTGTLGSAIGLLLGIAVSDTLYTLTLRTVHELFEATTWIDQDLSMSAFAKSLLVGLGAAATGALASAWQSRAVPPVTLMRQRVGATTGRFLRWSSAAVLVGTSGTSLFATDAGFLGVHLALFLLMAGFVLVGTDVVAVGAKLAAVMVRPFVHSLALWGLRNIPRLKRFYVLAVASLIIAVSIAMALQVMVGSFRLAVEQWIERGFDADFYLSLGDSIPGASFTEQDLENLRRLPGVARVAKSSRVVASIDGEPATLFVGDSFEDLLERFRPIVADAQAMESPNGVLITEAFAFYRGLRAGQWIEVGLAGQSMRVPIAGVVRDYSSGRGYAMGRSATLERLMHSPPVTSLAIYLERDARGLISEPQLRSALASQSGYRVRDSGFIKSFTLKVFDRTFEIITVLSAVVILTSCLGVMIALFTAQTEKTRDYRILRMLGVTPAEIGALVYREVAMVAGTSGIAAVPLAYLLAYVFCHKLMKQSFGWSFPLQPEPGAVAGILGVALAGSLAAGALVARVTARPQDGALRYGQTRQI